MLSHVVLFLFSFLVTTDDIPENAKRRFALICHEQRIHFDLARSFLLPVYLAGDFFLSLFLFNFLLTTLKSTGR